MRERKGLGAPVPEAAPVAAPTSARPHAAAVAESVPDQATGALSLLIGTRSWPLVGTRLLVGGAGGDVCAHVEIDDGSVSRRHAEFVASAGGWVLRDLGSTNGTWVGGRRLTAREAEAISAELMIRFGGVLGGAKVR